MMCSNVSDIWVIIKLFLLAYFSGISEMQCKQALVLLDLIGFLT